MVLDSALGFDATISRKLVSLAPPRSITLPSFEEVEKQSLIIFILQTLENIQSLLEDLNSLPPIATSKHLGELFVYIPEK
jgi:hypothetical protein